MDSLLLGAAWAVGAASLYMVADMVKGEVIGRRNARAMMAVPARRIEARHPETRYLDDRRHALPRRERGE